MTIVPLELPTFEAHVKEKDLDDFEERDQRMLLAMSVIEQKQDFTLSNQQTMNGQLRYLEAELIRQRKAKFNLPREILKWSGMTLSAAVILAMVEELIKMLFHK